MNDPTPESLPKGVQWSLELMAMVYVAVAVLFFVDADLPILIVNKAFACYDWPMVFFPTEKFWFSLALSVPATRAYLAFAAARKPAEARIFVRILWVSLLVTAIVFAWQFVFRKHAALYALACLIESVQVIFYLFLCKRLP
jgi:hypothetical protein